MEPHHRHIGTIVRTAASSSERRAWRLTIAEIRRRSAAIAELETSRAVKIVGAMYDLESGLVEFFV